MTDEEQEFSHHCPKCNHHNPTMCALAKELALANEVIEAAREAGWGIDGNQMRVLKDVLTKWDARRR